jgi:hypothetical protein
LNRKKNSAKTGKSPREPSSRSGAVVKPANFVDLLSKMQEGEVAPNVIDMMMLQWVLDQKGSTGDKSDAPEIAEVMELSRRAFSDDTASKQAAQAALFALRQSVASDEEGDGQEGIRQSEALLEHIDAADFPVTAAGAHLKIGAALSVQSQSPDDIDVDSLRRGVTHLESALALLPREAAAMRAMAHYNAALGFDVLWQSADDWEGDDDSRDKALNHGLAAIDAMNHGASVGNRDWVSRVVLKVLLADGRPRDAKARDQINDVVQAWLASPEGKALPPEDQSTLSAIVADHA